jgi:hypothetical protein
MPAGKSLSRTTKPAEAPGKLVIRPPDAGKLVDCVNPATTTRPDFVAIE